MLQRVESFQKISACRDSQTARCLNSDAADGNLAKHQIFGFEAVIHERQLLALSCSQPDAKVHQTGFQARRLVFAEHTS